jgi:hypothetical protein
MSTDLNTTKIDYAVSIARGVVGAVPAVGAIFSEIISEIVPNQRIDRIVAVLIELDKRLTEAEKRHFASNEYALNLFEDGMLQAARSLSERRNRYIAVFLKKCGEVNAAEYNVKKKLFYILEELTDLDIEILLSMEHGNSRNHEHDLRPDFVSDAQYRRFSDEEKFKYDSREETWGLHLSLLKRHGLIEPEYDKYDQTDPTRHLDEKTGLPNILRYRVTGLGKVFIRSIGEGEWKMR